MDLEDIDFENLMEKLDEAPKKSALIWRWENPKTKNAIVNTAYRRDYGGVLQKELRDKMEMEDYLMIPHLLEELGYEFKS